MFITVVILICVVYVVFIEAVCFREQKTNKQLTEKTLQKGKVIYLDNRRR